MKLTVNTDRGWRVYEHQLRYSLWERFLKKQKNNFLRNYKARQQKVTWGECILESQKSIWSKNKYKSNKEALKRKTVRTWRTALNRSYTNLYKLRSRLNLQSSSDWKNLIRKQSQQLYSWHYNNDVEVKKVKDGRIEISEEWYFALSRVAPNINYKIKKMSGWDKVIHHSTQYLWKRVKKSNKTETKKNKKIDAKNYLKVNRNILLTKYHRSIQCPWIKLISNAQGYILNQYKQKRTSYGKETG